MASGTKMTLKRYGAVTLDWDTQEIIVDQEFVDRHGLVIPIQYPFEPNLGLLEVHLNGQLLHSGGAYEEMYEAIKLDLGVDRDTGEPIQLEVGDEIHIKVYKNQYCSRGSGSFISTKEFNDLKQEIYDARRFKQESNSFPSLDSRLDHIQRSIEIIESGMANVDIEYEHNDKDQITKQIITGEYNLTREFEFNEINQISKEIIHHEGTTVTKEHIWDLDTGRMLRTRVRVV